MANLWHDVDRGDLDSLNVIIEISKGSRVKYELDKKTGLIMFDRVLYSPQFYATNYGFVPKTLWEDEDPLDVLVISEEPLINGCLVECRVVGAMDMIDGGDSDVKILAVPKSDPRFNEVKDLSDVNPHLLKELTHFFKTYKDLQEKKVEVGDWKNREKSVLDVKKSFELYDDKYLDKNLVN